MSIARKHTNTTTQRSSSNNRIMSALSNQKPWSHIELGAANYGTNPGADRTYIGKSLGQTQHALLFNTIDNLIATKGNKGVFYLNDLHEHDVMYTLDKLMEHLKQNHPNSEIRLLPLVGDYFRMNLPEVDSIHLKNPEYGFFETLVKEENKKRLAYFSDHSKEGLTFVTYYKRPFLHRFQHLGVGYKIHNDNFSPYIHADGSVVKKHGNVIEFKLKSLNTLEKEGSVAEFVTMSRYSNLEVKDKNRDVFGTDYNALSVFREDYNEPTFVPPNYNEKPIMSAQPATKVKSSLHTSFWKISPCKALAIATMATALGFLSTVALTINSTPSR